MLPTLARAGIPRFRIKRLSTRYALVIVAVLVLGMALVLTMAGYFVFRGTNQLREELTESFWEVQSAYDRRTLHASSRYLSQRLFDPLYHLDVTALNTEIERINAWLEPHSVQILDAQGRLVTDATVTNPDHGRAQPVPAALPYRDTLIEMTPAGKLLFFPIGYGDQIIGYARIVLSSAHERALLKGLREQVETAWRGFERWFLSIAALGLILAVLASAAIAWWLSVTLSRPLREMSRAAEQFASGNLSHQLPERAQDELGRLAGSLNRMAFDLQKAGRVLHRAQEIAAFGSWEWRRGNDSLQVSHGVYPILGLPQGAGSERIADIVAFAVPSDRDQLERVLRGGFETPVSFELGIRRADGAHGTVRIKGESELGEDGSLIGCFGTLQDITEQQQVQEQLVRLANVDTLTDLPNRNLFYDRLRQALRRARREQCTLALFFLDLDRFKEINDALGHDVGDELLREAAQRLRASVRESDTLARMGGDEFTLMIEDVCEAAAPAAVAQKLIDALEAPFRLAKRELFISASVGIALFPQDADDLDTLIKRADIAMYAAKEQGRGTFHFFTSKLQRAASERLALEHRLRGAIDTDALCLHYQPQVRTSDGRLIGIEALMRWEEGASSVPPASFVPVLEDTGLITRLTGMVLEEACGALGRLEAAGLANLRLSVNLSARQLRQPDLIALIELNLAAFELRPEQLEVEITESTLLDHAQCQKNAAQLGALGVRLAIDDFGTGYSSLTYLKRFDVDVLKIDRSFIDDMLHDPGDAQIVRAVVGLAAGLEIESVAEGVEREAQREQLRAIGCDLLQGYLIARPMPLVALLGWMQGEQGLAREDSSAAGKVLTRP